MNYKIANTFSLEIESTDVFSDVINSNDFNIHNDASIETPNVPKNSGTKINLSDERIKSYRRKLGVELVSNSPLTSDEESYKKVIEIISLLRKNGEKFNSNRSAIHVHVTLPPNLNILKSAISVGGNLEDIFFLLGGMGRLNRGTENNFTYCRPITGKGFPVIKNYNGDYVQCANFNDLLESETLEEFKTRYGDFINQRFNHYIPIRYTWLNLIPIFVQGSIEFRIFNVNPNPLSVFSIGVLSLWTTQLILEKAYNSPEESLEVNSAFSPRNKGEMIKHFEETFSKFIKTEMEGKIFNHLIYLLEKSSIPQIEDRYVFSHLMFHRRGDKTQNHFSNDYCPSIIKEDILVPNFVDIHVLRGENN